MFFVFKYHGQNKIFVILLGFSNLNVLKYRTGYLNWADRHNFAIARGAKKGITIRCSGGCHDSKPVTQNVVVRSI